MRKNNNILIISAGRRVSLLKSFKVELVKRIPKAKVFAADMYPEWSAACRVAEDSFQLPSAKSPLFIDELIQLCTKLEVGMVVPTIDNELLVLSQNREMFEDEGINIVISDVDLIMRCRDKRKTNELFLQFGIAVPSSIDKASLRYPFFVKPFDGSMSKGTKAIKNKSELSTHLLKDDKLMFMEYLNPEEYQEFTIDLYFNREGSLKCVVPRRRIEVRGGEISKGKTEKGNVYAIIRDKFNFLAGARGCLTMQVFENRATNKIKGIEINPRFGGGYPLSYASGANYPGFLIEEYFFGNELQFFDDWANDKVMLRYDSEFIFDA